MTGDLSAVDFDAVGSDLDFLKHKLETLEKLDEDISTLGVQTLDEAVFLNELNDSCDVLHKNMDRIRKVERFLVKHAPPFTITSAPTVSTSVSSPASSSSSSMSRLRLPKLNLVKFDGSDVRKWTEFYDTFVAEIHSQPMDNVTKLRYLMGLLEGKAKDRVSHYRASNAAYQEVLDKLQDDFGNQQKIIDAHIESLNSIKPAVDNSDDLRRFLDSVLYNTGSLAQLSLSCTSYGPFLVPTLCKKLPVSVQMKVLDITKAKTPSLDEFIDILSLEVRKREEVEVMNAGLQGIQMSSSDFSYPMTPVSTLANVTSPAQKRPPRKTTSRRLPCVFCTETSHPPSRCSLPVQERMNIARNSRLCFNCLGDHRRSDCPSKGSCATCKGGHHTALHGHTCSLVSSAGPPRS